MTLNALNQPRTGYTYGTDVRPADRASLFALRDLLLEMRQSEAAQAVERAITACSEAAANLTAVELASALDLDPQAEARETERDTAWVGELVEHPTYDQLIAGAKFTDQHRADLHKWWNEKYQDKEVKNG